MIQAKLSEVNSMGKYNRQCKVQPYIEISNSFLKNFCFVGNPCITFNHEIHVDFMQVNNLFKLVFRKTLNMGHIKVFLTFWDTLDVLAFYRSIF